MPRGQESCAQGHRIGFHKAGGHCALPFGPGFRLRRNHANGAFPPFGFNPITLKVAAAISRQASPVEQGNLGADHGRHSRPMTRLGISVRFGWQADERREARIISLAGAWRNVPQRSSGHTGHGSTCEGQTRRHPQAPDDNRRTALMFGSGRDRSRRSAHIVPDPGEAQDGHHGHILAISCLGAPSASSTGKV